MFGSIVPTQATKLKGEFTVMTEEELMLDYEMMTGVNPIEEMEAARKGKLHLITIDQDEYEYEEYCLDMKTQGFVPSRKEFRNSHRAVQCEYGHRLNRKPKTQK